MLDFLRKLLRPKYPTLNKIEIRGANIIANYKYLQSLQSTAAIFPVLKSNAYGHGLKEIAKLLNKTSAPIVAVDSFPEAQVVYKYFKRDVLILGEMPHHAYKYLHFSKTEVVVYNTDTLKYLSRFGKKIKIHLFINSGMNREGIQNFGTFLLKNKDYLDRVSIVGICSHLASADEVSPLNKRQELIFIEAVEKLRSAGYFPRWVHLGNSAAIWTLHNKLLTAYRTGLALYGYNPLIDNKEPEEFLKPALQLFSHIIAIQNLKAGETVSYNENYQTKVPTQIALIPFGYFEGLDRRFSNRASFLVKSSQEEFIAQVAGNVSMNLTCLLVGSHTVALGNIVNIISNDSSAINSVHNLAGLIGTVPYELLVRLQANIRREVV